MSKKLLLCDEPSEYQTGYDLVVYWSSFQESNDTYSVPRVIELESDFLKKKYLDWIYELGHVKVNGCSVIDFLLIRKNFSYWWMTLIVEKSQWKSPEIYNVLRLMAFELILDQHDVNWIDVSCSDQSVHKSIKQYCKQYNKKFNLLSVKEHNRHLPSIFQLMAQSFTFLVFYLKERWVASKLKKKQDHRDKANNEISFFSYFFNLDKRSIDKGRFRTGYWSTLHDILPEKKVKINWHHIFIPNEISPTAKDAVEVIQKINSSKSSNQVHTLFDSELCWKVILHVLRDYFKVVIFGLKIKSSNLFFQKSNSKFELWPILQNDFYQSFFGVTAMSNILFLNLLERSVSRLPYQKKGFYLMENQAWERSLIHAWNSAGHGELVGVVHTAVAYWDLRHFFNEKEYDSFSKYKMPLPDKIALNGSAAYKMYFDSSFPESRILCVEALRYLYLDKVNNNKKDGVSQTPSRVLILGDYQSSATYTQMSLLVSAVDKLSKNIEFFVKSHPANPIIVADWPELKMRVVSDSLEQLVDQYDIAYTSNATASALDAYLSGKYVITVLDPKALNLSPLFGQAEGVEFVSTASELIEKLNYAVCHAARKYKKVDFLLTNSKLTRWNDVLSD
jgi:surface carbohydrate biosynthesis protein (TIGR04326 family)